MEYLLLIGGVSFVVTLISTLAYKYTTDQGLIKRTKEDIKKLRDKQKKHRDDKEKMLEIQQKMMSKNMIIMKQSFKPMIYTVIPFLLVFAWLAANLVFVPLQPNQSFDVYLNSSELDLQGIDLEGAEIINVELEEDVKTWTIRVEDSGSRELIFRGEGFLQTKSISVGGLIGYEQPVKAFDEGEIVVVHEVVRPFGEFKFFNWSPQWLGTYILFALVFSLLLRKLLRVS